MKIYARIDFAETRVRKGYSIVGLAKALGITKQGLSQFEKRMNGMSPENSQILIKLFEVEFDDIFELVERI